MRGCQEILDLGLLNGVWLPRKMDHATHIFRFTLINTFLRPMHKLVFQSDRLPTPSSFYLSFCQQSSQRPVIMSIRSCFISPCHAPYCSFCLLSPLKHYCFALLQNAFSLHSHPHSSYFAACQTNIGRQVLQCPANTDRQDRVA